MDKIKKKLLEQLKKIQGNGSFEISGVEKITTPGLNIKGIGEIALPVSPEQIKEIIKISKKAPFGKGSQTITDTKIRSAWELNADQLSFHNEDWTGFLKKVIENVKEGLGIEENPVKASLYKLLIYEEGDFFLSHQDSEKEKGMFGTLVIGLPSNHTGGELVIRFDGKEKIIDFSVPSSNYKIPYCAFFADCDHEIKPITSGFRVALVYNLLQTTGNHKLDHSKISSHIDQMAAVLKSMSNAIENRPIAILLEHQYTPANFSINSLKHHDKPRAELLLEAAVKAGFFATPGLVTHYKVGEMDVDGYDYEYGYNRNNSSSSENSTMGEVIEEYTTIEHWSEGEIPPLGILNIQKEDLIADYELGEDDPIEEEEEGYTGNAGMTVEYWYHYGAIILWSNNKHIEILASASIEVKLKWLEYYYQHWENTELDSRAQIKKILIQLTELDLTNNLPSSDDFSILAPILIKLKDKKYVSESCEALLTAVFEKIQVNNWVALLQNFDPKIFASIFETIGNNDNVYRLNHLLEILKSIQSTSSPAIEPFLQDQVQCIPSYLANNQLSKLNKYSDDSDDPNSTRKDTIITSLKNVIVLSRLRENDANWIKRMIDAITKVLTRKYVNKVLIPVSLKQESTLAKQILQECTYDLTRRTSIKPMPPKDWKRDVPEAKYENKLWKLLRPFLESKDNMVFEYKKIEADRRQMEDAIKKEKVDLKIETIRKGSPYTLKITKTQASYERALKEWKEDMEILESIK